MGEIEVSIFGTGKGESLAVHLGDKRWLIVDTCLRDGRPAALGYLTALDGAAGHSVTAIVVTHWDEDHAEGAEALMDRHPDSLFVMSRALTLREFGAVLHLERNSPDTGKPPGHSPARLARIVHDRLRTGSHEYKLAFAGRAVIEETLSSGIRVRVEALAPSQATLKASPQLLNELLDAWTPGQGCGGTCRTTCRWCSGSRSATADCCSAPTSRTPSGPGKDGGACSRGSRPALPAHSTSRCPTMDRKTPTTYACGSRWSRTTRSRR